MLPTRGDSLLLFVPQMDREHLDLIAQEDEFSAAVDGEASRAELEMRLTHLIEGFKQRSIKATCRKFRRFLAQQPR